MIHPGCPSVCLCHYGLMHKWFTQEEIWHHAWMIHPGCPSVCLWYVGFMPEWFTQDIPEFVSTMLVSCMNDLPRMSQNWSLSWWFHGWVIHTECPSDYLQHGGDMHEWFTWGVLVIVSIMVVTCMSDLPWVSRWLSPSWWWHAWVIHLGCPSDCLHHGGDMHECFTWIVQVIISIRVVTCMSDSPGVSWLFAW